MATVRKTSASQNPFSVVHVTARAEIRIDLLGGQNSHRLLGLKSLMVYIASPVHSEGQMWTSHYLWEMLNLDPFFLHFSKVYVCVSATSKHNDFMVMDWMIPLLWDFSSCLSKCALEQTKWHLTTDCLLLWYETIFKFICLLCFCKMK